VGGTMDLLDRLLGHDVWTTRLLLMRCEQLSDEELDREFDIGHRSVRRMLLHIIRNVEVWTDLMRARGPCGRMPGRRRMEGRWRE
jgi:uncharacterized damage-inducible protein DinB